MRRLVVAVVPVGLGSRDSHVTLVSTGSLSSQPLGVLVSAIELL